MKKRVIWCCFVAGVLAGIVTAWGAVTLFGRTSTPGGEILLPLLIAGCIYMGYQLRQLTEKQTKRR